MADAGFTAFPERHSSECPDKRKQYLKTTGCVIICFSVLIATSYLFQLFMAFLRDRSNSVPSRPFCTESCASLFKPAKLKC